MRYPMKTELMPPLRVEALAAMPAADFETRLAVAKPGEQIIYHRGLLMHDRMFSAVVRTIGKTAYAAWVSGRAHLAQRRVSPGVCEYIAERI